MAELFKINDSLANKISYYHLMALLVSLPFDLFYSHLILISYIIHTLIHLKKAAIKPVFNMKILALQSVFLLTVLSTIYSINKPEAFNEWGKHLAIFIFPLLFCLNPLDIRKYQPKLLQAFALICTATVVYLYTDAFITIGHYKLAWSTIFTSHFTNHNFSEPIGMHATFFSMQLIIALAYLVSAAMKDKRTTSKLFDILCCIILTAGIIQLSSKAALIVLVVMINIAAPWFLLRGKTRLEFIAASVLLTILAAGIILTSSAFRYRVVTGLKIDMAKPTITEIHDGRLARWEATWELIRKKPLSGYGAGTEIGLLQDSFFRKKMYDSFLERLNGHNEYLSIALKSGIIGLMIYLATLVIGFKVSIDEKDLPFFVFMAVIAVVSVSENLLDVDKGTFFYALFFSFFMFSVKKKQENSIPGPELSKMIASQQQALIETAIQI